MAVNSGTYRTNPLIVFLSALLVTFLSILVFLLIIRNVYGRFSSSELLPDLNVVKNLIFGSEPEIAILKSGYTANLLPDGSTWQNDNIATWKKFISSFDIKYEIIDDSKIEKGEHLNYKLIVLPGSKSLSDKEIIQLKKFVREGGSIFATGGTASYSSDGKWRGWQFLSEVFGISFSRQINNDESTKIHTLRGGLPITANVPTGFPLRIATWDRPIAAEVLDPRTTQVSFWYNYRIEEGLVREGIKKSAGIVYGTYGKGRFVWMGFEINSIIGIKDDYVFFDRIFKNSINWLTYLPIAFIRDWPAGFNSAAVLVTSIDEKNENIQELLQILKNNNLSSTFFVNSNFAEKNTKLVKSLDEFGEVAALVDLEYNFPVKHEPKDNQETKLLRKLTDAEQIISEITGKPVNGFLSYSGTFDQTIINSAINSGYNYFLSDSLTDRSVPKIFSYNHKRIVAITKSARDDLEVIRDYGLEKPEFQFYSYQEDLDRVLFEGGLYVFKIHPEYQCKPENSGVIKNVIKELQRKNFWITTLDKIEEWFVHKENVELRTKKMGKTRVAVTITNPGKVAIDKMKIDVDLNENAAKISIETEIIGTKKASYIHKDGSRFVYLMIDFLEAGESRTYYIDYDIVS